MTESGKENSGPVFDFEGKHYDFNSLEEATRKLVHGLRGADTQIRMHKDTLNVLEVGRLTMAKQLQEKLKTAKPLN